MTVELEDETFSRQIRTQKSSLEKCMSQESGREQKSSLNQDNREGSIKGLLGKEKGYQNLEVKNLMERFKRTFSGGSVGKESACKAGDAGDTGSIPGLGRSPAGRHGNPL